MGVGVIMYHSVVGGELNSILNGIVYMRVVTLIVVVRLGCIINGV